MFPTLTLVLVALTFVGMILMWIGLYDIASRLLVKPQKEAVETAAKLQELEAALYDHSATIDQLQERLDQIAKSLDQATGAANCLTVDAQMDRKQVNSLRACVDDVARRVQILDRYIYERDLQASTIRQNLLALAATPGPIATAKSVRERSTTVKVAMRDEWSEWLDEKQNQFAKAMREQANKLVDAESNPLAAEALPMPPKG